MSRTYEEIEELIKLTPDQEKAWRSFVRATKKCEKSGLTFYTVLDSIMALNGEHIDSIENVEYSEFAIGDPEDLNHHQLPSHSNLGFAGFADDTHVVLIKEND